MLARTTSAQARPLQKMQMKQLVSVTCLGLVGAALMWLACWAKPSRASQWLEGSCEIYSATVSRDRQDRFLVRLDARFFHPSLREPAVVWANGAAEVLSPPNILVGYPHSDGSTVDALLLRHQNMAALVLKICMAETRLPLQLRRQGQRPSAARTSTVAVAALRRDAACTLARHVSSSTNPTRHVLQQVRASVSPEAGSSRMSGYLAMYRALLAAPTAQAAALLWSTLHPPIALWDTTAAIRAGS
jgi:hypothetical protein